MAPAAPGRILDDMGAAGAMQFSGSGPIRHVRLPGNTLQIRGQSVCASLKGIPFEPCFNLDKTGRPQLPRLGLRAWASPIAISTTRAATRC